MGAQGADMPLSKLGPGGSIDTWIIEKQLGKGGMGSVFKCHNRAATRMVVAVKVLDPAIAAMMDIDQRFVREAEMLYRLDHPNVVKVRNISIEPTLESFIVMEYVEGRNVDDILEPGPIPIDTACDLILQLFEAINYLHAHNIRHRDIKPSNVLVRPDGVLKLVDFGLALDEDVDRITIANATLGTVNYAPPEWINPESMDPVKWDLYSAGVVAYEMLTANVAFPNPAQGSQAQQVMKIMLTKQTAKPLDPGEGVPAELRKLIRDLTEVDPSRRPASAQDCIDRMLAFYARPVRQVAVRRTTSSIPSGARFTSALDSGSSSSSLSAPTGAVPPRIQALVAILSIVALLLTLAMVLSFL